MMICILNYCANCICCRWPVCYRLFFKFCSIVFFSLSALFWYLAVQPVYAFSLLYVFTSTMTVSEYERDQYIGHHSMYKQLHFFRRCPYIVNISEGIGRLEYVPSAKKQAISNVSKTRGVVQHTERRPWQKRRGKDMRFDWEEVCS